jgi:predicted transcriptional regulator
MSEPTIADAQEVLDRAHRIARAAIANAPTWQQALEWAAQILKAAERTRDQMQQLRDEATARIWDEEEEEVTYSEIARPLGVSKQRVAQILTEAKAAAQAGEGE